MFLGKAGLWLSYFISRTKGEGFLAEKSGLFEGRSELASCCHWDCKAQLEESMRWAQAGKKGWLMEGLRIWDEVFLFVPVSQEKAVSIFEQKSFTMNEGQQQPEVGQAGRVETGSRHPVCRSNGCDSAIE